jgi:hypothetical protein
MAFETEEPNDGELQFSRFAQMRSKYANVLQSYAPEWSGTDSWTNAEYETILPIDCPVEAERALWIVVFIDLIRRMSDKKYGEYVLLSRDLAIFVELIVEVKHRILEEEWGPVLSAGHTLRDRLVRGAHRTNKIRNDNRPDYASAVEKKMQDGLNYTGACEQVAVHFDVTSRTVRNYSKQFQPRNRRTSGKNA